MCTHLRCKRQSYLKQRRQNNVRYECIVCSGDIVLAFGPSMHSVISMYLLKRKNIFSLLNFYQFLKIKMFKFNNIQSYLFCSWLVVPLSGNISQIALKISRHGNGFLSFFGLTSLPLPLTGSASTKSFLESMFIAFFSPLAF